VRFLLLFSLLACVGKPCPFICEGDSDCAAFSTCFNHTACLSNCSNIVCGGVCVDSFHNCGSCGVQCGPEQVCAHSGCAAACEAGLTSCSGSCLDLANDRLNCGACGHICANNEQCGAGVCKAVCE
jgi:hypothetical protein